MYYLFYLNNGKIQNTFEFLKKYKIPFILFDFQKDGLKFSDQNSDPLDIFILGLQNHYLSNKKNYEDALKDEMKDDLNEKFDDEYSESLDDESEDDKDKSKDSKNDNKIKNILLNQ